MDKDTLKRHITDTSQWLRLVFMALFAVVLYVSLVVLVIVVVVQWLFALIAGQAHSGIRDFSQSLAAYIHQIVNYLTYLEEDKPYPFSPLPTAVVEEVVDVDEVDEHVIEAEPLDGENRQDPPHY